MTVRYTTTTTLQSHASYIEQWSHDCHVKKMITCSACDTITTTITSNNDHMTTLSTLKSCEQRDGIANYQTLTSNCSSGRTALVALSHTAIACLARPCSSSSWEYSKYNAEGNKITRRQKSILKDSTTGTCTVYDTFSYPLNKLTKLKAVSY